MGRKKKGKIKTSAIILDSDDSVFWFGALEGFFFPMLSPTPFIFLLYILSISTLGSMYNKIYDLNA